MGCGLDTRPAALACLRIIIAALNILIAVSSSFFYKHHKRFNLLECSLMGNNQGPIEYCKIFIESRLLILGIFLSTFFSCQILIFLLDSSPLIVLIVCSSQFFFRLNLDFLPPPAAASSCWDSGSKLDVLPVNRIKEEPWPTQLDHETAEAHVRKGTKGSPHLKVQ